MLHSITLDQYCQHTCSIEFLKGVNIVIAPNGTGKSKLMEGWRWSGFGTQGMKGSQDRVVQWGADYCKAQSVMDVAGKPTTFFRQIPKSGAVGAMVEVEGERVAETPSAVKDFLAQNGIDWNSVSMVYAQQRELSYFVHAVPSVRKELISSLFRVGLDDAIKAVKEDLAEVKEAALSSPDFTERRELFQGLFDEAKQKVKATKSTVKKLLAEMKELQAEYDAFEDVDDKVLAKRKRIQTTVDLQENQITIWRQEIGPLKKFLERPGKPEEYTEEDEKDRVEWASEYETTEEQVRITRQELVDLSQTKQEYKTKISLVKEGKCSKCGQDYDTSQLSEMESLLEEASSRLAEEIKYLDKLHEALANCGTEVQTLKDKKVAAEIYLQEGEEYEQQIRDIEVEIQDAEAVLSPLYSELMVLPEVSEADVLDKLKKEVEVNSCSDSLSLALDRLENNRINKAKYKMQLKEIDQEVEAYAGVKARYAQLKVLRKAIPAFRDKVLSDNLVWVSNRATTLLSYATMETWEISVNDELAVEVNGHPVDDYSTGQVDLICVALRIAIAEFLSTFGLRGMLILDGVFDSVDESNIAAVGRLVSQIGVDQVIILSHFDIDSIEGANKIYLGELYA